MNKWVKTERKKEVILYFNLSLSSCLIFQLDSRCYLEEVSDWSSRADVSVHCLHFVDAAPRCSVLCKHIQFSNKPVYTDHIQIQIYFCWPGIFPKILYWNLNDLVIKYRVSSPLAHLRWKACSETVVSHHWHPWQ